MRWSRVRTATAFAAKNFATPIVFYTVFEKVGIKPAIAFAVGVAVLQTLAHVIFKWRFSLFFILATGFTVLFGTMDLLIATPRYFRLEAFFQNLTVGILFLGTLAMQKSMIWHLVMSMPGEFRPKIHEVTDRYLRKLTVVWSGYFIAKAFVFLYIALRVDLGQLYIYRVVLGNGSALILFFGEVLYRRMRRRSYS